jgi:hypothetical protein
MEARYNCAAATPEGGAEAAVQLSAILEPEPSRGVAGCCVLAIRVFLRDVAARFIVLTGVEVFRSLHDCVRCPVPHVTRAVPELGCIVVIGIAGASVLARTSTRPVTDLGILLFQLLHSFSSINIARRSPVCIVSAGLKVLTEVEVISLHHCVRCPGS